MLKIAAAVVFLGLTIGCLLVAGAGDNTDARALAGIFYVPAIAFGIIDAALWAWILL